MNVKKFEIYENKIPSLSFFWDNSFKKWIFIEVIYKLLITRVFLQDFFIDLMIQSIKIFIYRIYIEIRTNCSFIHIIL